MACLRGARVRNIEAGGVVLLDYQDSERARIDDEIEWDPTIFRATREAAWIITPENDTSSIELETVFTLIGC